MSLLLLVMPVWFGALGVAWFFLRHRVVAAHAAARAAAAPGDETEHERVGAAH